MQTTNNEYNRDRQLEMELETATASILPENNNDINDYNVKLVIVINIIIQLSYVLEKWNFVS